MPYIDRLEADFDLFFKSQGGICREPFSSIPIISETLNYARIKIELLRKIEKGVPPIYVDFINDFSLNANAGRKETQYFIGINIGALLHTYSIFTRMLSCNTILKDVGDITSENTPQKVFDIQLKNADQGLSLFSRELIPRDPIRKSTVHQLMNYVIDFLVYHEYAHIAYGHVDYKIANSTCAQSITPFLQQSIEVWADGFAALASMEFSFEVDEKTEDISRLIKRESFNQNPQLRLWLFAIYTYFRLFGHMNQRYSIPSNSYPPPSCRANLVLDTMHAYINNDFDSTNPDGLTKWTIDAMMEVEKAFDEISEQGLDTRPLYYGFSEQVVEHSKELLDKQEDLLELMKEYSFIPRYL